MKYLVICLLFVSVSVSADTVTKKGSNGRDKEYPEECGVTTEKFLLNGRNVTEAPPKLTGDNRQIWNKIIYSRITCDVNWNQYCEHKETFVAPAGWQICKPLYKVEANMNRTSHRWTPGNWYTNDPESPDRYRSLDFYMGADGSGNLFNQWGSKISLLDVGYSMIPASATNDDRYECGCNMPPHD